MTVEEKKKYYEVLLALEGVSFTDITDFKDWCPCSTSEPYGDHGEAGEIPVWSYEGTEGCLHIFTPCKNHYFFYLNGPWKSIY
jgi:hypothetical protein